MRLPVSISIDPTSFLLGFAFATIFWWVVSRARPLWTEIVTRIRRRPDEAAAQSMSGTGEDHRHVPLRGARGTHHAARLADVEPGGLLRDKDIVTVAIPYMPAWPELAAVHDPNEAEGLAALGFRQRPPDDRMIKQMCAATYGDDSILREAAFSVLGRLEPRAFCTQTPSSSD